MTDDLKPQGGDAALILLQRLSESQVEHGRKQDEQLREIHEARRLIDVVNTRLEPLASLPARVGVLETSVELNKTQGKNNSTRIDALEQRTVLLEAEGQKRKGWETPLGRGGAILFAAIIGALVTLIVGALTAKGAELEHTVGTRVHHEAGLAKR